MQPLHLHSHTSSISVRLRHSRCHVIDVPFLKRRAKGAALAIKGLDRELVVCFRGAINSLLIFCFYQTRATEVLPTAISECP